MNNTELWILAGTSG